MPRVELADLDNRGKTELVQVLIPLQSLAVEDAAPEVQKMLTPFGAVSMLSKSNALVVVDTAGNVRRIYATLQEVENGQGDAGLIAYKCLYKKAAELAEEVKTLLADKDTPVTVAGGGNPQGYYDPRGYDPRQFGGSMGGAPRDRRDPRQGGGGGANNGVKNVSITVDVTANTITVTAPPDKAALAKKLLAELDKPKTPLRFSDGYEPPIRKYSVPAGTAEAVAKALNAENTSIKAVAVPRSDDILVLAPEAQHEGIEAKIKELTAAKKPEPKK